MEIPEHAKRVFNGKIFDVYHWEQEMFDGTKETFEALRRMNTVQVIPTKGDKIFIGHEEQPNKPLFHSLFGGRQEKNEEPLETAKRELLEESGLSSEDWELLYVYEPMTKIDWKIYLFAARDCNKVAEPNHDPGEKIEVEEVDFDKFFAVVQSETFWGREIANDMIKLKWEGKLEEFKRKLFGK